MTETRGMRYGKTDAKPGERVVHNFPARGRPYGQDGFRYWVEPEDAPGGERRRCYCDFVEHAPIHYGTYGVVSEDGEDI